MIRQIFVLLLSAALGPAGAYAQSAREDIAADPCKAGGVYYAYPAQEHYDSTPAPRGYKPFYISHFGRHGSRWLLHQREYDDLQAVFAAARQAGALTSRGEEIAAAVDSLCRAAETHAGDLTPIGIEQHKGIARRMYAGFPEVFDRRADVSATSSVTVRCVVSMANFCAELQRHAPKIVITQDANLQTTAPINFFNKKANPELSDRYLDFMHGGAWHDDYRIWRNEHLHPERLAASLFADAGYISQSGIDAQAMMLMLFNLAVNMQNVDPDISLFDLFTDDEIYECWRATQYEFFVHRGPCPLNEDYPLYYSCALMRDIIARADEAIARGDRAADLRFGHDGNIMPFTNLLMLEGYCRYTSSPEEFCYWKDYEMTPMAANLQFVFYRRSRSNDPDDILVKLLHNEKEVRLPLPDSTAPYYRWSDFRRFYTERMASIVIPEQ
ncbi:MAG: histidine-type phosphatase [Alistipes sp.]|nr:histidine-type phosphatase [Alistipes sp.]